MLKEELSIFGISAIEAGLWASAPEKPEREFTASPRALALASEDTLKKLKPVCANFVWLNEMDVNNPNSIAVINSF
jgi:hypothetical protein